MHFLKKNNSGTYNLGVKHDFDKEGHHLELEFDYNKLESENTNAFEFAGNSPLSNYRESIDDTRTNTTINLDYTNPLSENATLEIGVETRLRRTDNTYQTTNTSLNNSSFAYDRDIYSFYTTFSQKFNKWQYNLGLRFEDYHVTALFSEVGENPDPFKSISL